MNPLQSLSLVMALSAAIGRGVSVKDDWDRAGVIAVTGARWSALFRRGSRGALITADGQRVEIRFSSGEEGDPIHLETCKQTPCQDEWEAGILAEFAGVNRSAEIRCSFDATGNVRVETPADSPWIEILGDLRFGLLPSLILESVLYEVEKLPRGREICIPSENWFAGLLGDGDGIVTCAWPDGDQEIRLASGEDEGVVRIRIKANEAPLFLRLASCAGIWHAEGVDPRQQERDVALRWKPPFPASWWTEMTVNWGPCPARGFPFEPGRRDVWWPMIGSFAWPVWFEASDAMLRFDKRIRPLDKIIVIPLEGHQDALAGLPESVLAGKSLERQRTRGAPLPGLGETPQVGFTGCWGTQLITASVYRAGAHEREKAFLRAHVQAMESAVRAVQAKNAGRIAFIAEMRDWLTTRCAGRQDADPVVGYAKQMLGDVDQMDAWIQGEMSLLGEKTPDEHIAHAHRLAQRLTELLETPGDESFPEAKDILSLLNDLSWRHDEEISMGFSLFARSLAMDAARDSVSSPEAAKIASEIRRKIAESLSTVDSPC